MVEGRGTSDSGPWPIRDNGSSGSTTSARLPDPFATFPAQSNDETPEALPVLDEVLTGRKILIVDDDVRNIFALTCVLEQYGIEVLYAENGREGIDMLERNDDVDRS